MSEKIKKNDSKKHNEKVKDEVEVVIKKKDFEIIKRLITEAENNILSIKNIMFLEEYKKQALNLKAEGGKIVEGVFDGESMINKEGKKYAVPANYASKSKLVPGDILKLTITDEGGFIYKQIGPVERKKMIGELLFQNGKYIIKSEGKKYNVLLASVTYFKAQAEDKVTIIVPKDGESEWATIENIVQ